MSLNRDAKQQGVQHRVAQWNTQDGRERNKQNVYNGAGVEAADGKIKIQALLFRFNGYCLLLLYTEIILSKYD